jgi:hypothetical protein
MSFGCLMACEEVRGAVIETGAFGGDDFPDKLVPRQVAGDTVVNPFIPGLYGFGPKFSAIEQEEVGPAVGPVIDEFGAQQESFDELITFGGVGAAQKVTNFISRGQGTDGIEERAADKDFVAAAGRGCEVESLELRQNVLVDEVSSRGRGIDFGWNGVWERDCHAGNHNAAGEPRGYGTFAGPRYLNNSVFIHSGYSFCCGSEASKLCDVFDLTVCVVSGRTSSGCC